MVVGDVVAGTGSFDQSREGSRPLSFDDNGDTFQEPLPDIAEISIDGARLLSLDIVDQPHEP